MRGFKRNLMEQMNQETTEMTSFRQDKFAIGDQEYDLTKPLTYEQALSHVKTKLKDEVANALEESTRQRHEGVVIQKNKAYLRNMIEKFTTLITDIVEDYYLRL